MTFADFMATALYDREGGYYVRYGAGRDYRSAPQTSPAFGHLVGAALARMWAALDRPARFDAIELGAGDGRLAEQIVGYLRSREPSTGEAVRYVAIDRGGDTWTPRTPSPARTPPVVADAAMLPVRGVVGCVLSNELFDALPVHRLTWDGERWRELWVEPDGEGWRFVVGELSDPALGADVATRAREPARGQVVDLAPGAAQVVEQIAGALERGFVLTIDYGGAGSDLYGRHRLAGTLLAYHAHRASDDVLARPGEQDLTAHVDFDLLSRAGEAAGLRTFLETTQRDFLLGLGLRDWLGRLDPSHLTPADLFNAQAAAAELIDTRKLGKLRVLVQARGVATGPELFG
jgi:SAM-dependent MidA family methyltransferase